MKRKNWGKFYLQKLVDNYFQNFKSMVGNIFKFQTFIQTCSGLYSMENNLIGMGSDYLIVVVLDLYF